MMEQKEVAKYANWLSDNLNTSTPVDIVLSTTPKLLCNSTTPLLKKRQSDVSDEAWSYNTKQQ